MAATETAAVFYDHAKNHTNVAQAVAVAHARRTSLDDGTAYTVHANWPGGDRFYWDGCYYDALQLANDLRRNRAENVTLVGPNGPVDIESARY